MSIISWSPISCCNGQTCKVSFSWSPILAAISKLFFCNGIFRGRVARGHEFTNRICWALTKRYAYKGRGEKVVIFQDFCHKASDPTSAPLMALLATQIPLLFSFAIESYIYETDFTFGTSLSSKLSKFSIIMVSTISMSVMSPILKTM